MLTYKKSYIVFVILFYLLLFEVAIGAIFPIINNLDELIAISAIPIFIIYHIKENIVLSKRSLVIFLCVITYVILGLLGNIKYNIQPSWFAILEDLLSCTKFWLSFYVGSILFKNFELNKENKLFKHVYFVTICLFVLAIADYTFKIFPSGYRNGIRYIQLFYPHTTYLAAACVYLLAITIALWDMKRSKLIIFMQLSIIVATMRSKAIAASIVFVFLFYWVVIKKRKVKLRMLVIMGLVIFLSAWQQIKFYFVIIAKDSARYMMLIKSFQIAKDYSPLGSGFGTFATAVSGNYYSPLYYKYFLFMVNGLSPDNPEFVSDSFWPAIIAQFGWIGICAWICLLVVLFLAIQKIRKVNIYWYASGIFMYLYLLITSTSESSFFNPYSISIALLLGIICSKNSNFKMKLERK